MPGFNENDAEKEENEREKKMRNTDAKEKEEKKNNVEFVNQMGWGWEYQKTSGEKRVKNLRNSAKTRDFVFCIFSIFVCPRDMLRCLER